MKIRQTWLWLLLFGSVGFNAFAADPCGVCGKEIKEFFNTWSDKVTGEKKRLCTDCTKLPDNCFLCSLPLSKNYTTLPDGRTICERDRRTVVLDDKEATEICVQVKANLDRQFIRFITFPDTNVTVGLMDRVAIQEIYKFAGNDFSCPNMWGCTVRKTNDQQRSYEISLLSGLPRELLATTCVHEYTHTWIFENVPPARSKSIGKDAVEGFCELLSYLYAEQHGLAAGKSEILTNNYTRGQIHLFLSAHHQYGFEDIVDWMKSGDDPLLLKEDLSRVRRLEDSPKIVVTTTNPLPASVVTANTNPPPRLPEKLALQGITWSKTQPMAIINAQTFGVNDQAVVKLATTNLPIRCLEIRTNSVLIRIEDSGANQELFLPEN